MFEHKLNEEKLNSLYKHIHEEVTRNEGKSTVIVIDEDQTTTEKMYKLFSQSPNLIPYQVELTDKNKTFRIMGCGDINKPPYNAFNDFTKLDVGKKL